MCQQSVLTTYQMPETRQSRPSTKLTAKSYVHRLYGPQFPDPRCPACKPCCLLNNGRNSECLPEWTQGMWEGSKGHMPSLTTCPSQLMPPVDPGQSLPLLLPRSPGRLPLTADTFFTLRAVITWLSSYCLLDRTSEKEKSWTQNGNCKGTHEHWWVGE